MRVLYVLRNPNALSEGYIRQEREWMESKGVLTSIWSSTYEALNLGGYDLPPGKLLGGDIETVIEKFKPNILHVHWVKIGPWVLDVADRKRLPVTMRGHSFDDRRWKTEAVINGHESVRRVWLFEAHCWNDPRIAPMSVCYDPRLYYPEKPTLPRYVFRSAAHVKTKAIDEFSEIASLCPGIKFVLAIAHVVPLKEKLIGKPPPNMTILPNLPREENAEMTRKAYVCLRGFDPSRPYGMPESIAEAMGSGLPIITRSGQGSVSFVNDAGLYYKTVSEASNLVKEVMAWTTKEQEEATARSLARSANLKIDHILPPMLDYWKTLA